MLPGHHPSQRSVSLPASAVGASKLAVTAVGAYARIRKQFRVPIELCVWFVISSRQRAQRVARDLPT